jgi:ABC-type dipeptide/oligopeptide/nickel transport system permease subunit
MGHDILSQVIYGAYPSMIPGVVAALGAVALGFVVGLIAGYFGRLEGLLTGLMDVMITFPALPLMLLIGEMFVPSNALITAILIVVLWPPIARSIRSQVLSLKRRLFVQAARTSGMGDLEIVGRIITPEVISIAFAYFVLTVATAIVLITALQFLGVGNPTQVSWGSILYWAQQFAFYSGDWWWVLAPGILITLVALGFALIGFSVEEVMNPRLKV